MSSQDVRNTLQEALKALYHHPEQQVRKQANEWLQEFQRTVEAWQVSDNLLHDANSNLETLIFCSQTLKTKVQRDFEELPPTAFVPLRDSLKNLLKKLCKGPSKVRTQVSVAMAALAVHVSAQDWGGGGVLNWLRDEEAYSYKIAARPERRRQFQKELVSSVEVAFSLLNSCLSVEELREQDEEIVKAMARLFAEMGDSYVELIASGSAESMLIVEALVEVTSHPHYDIAAMTFNFWHSLQLILTKREYYLSFGNEAAIEAERERRLTIFRPIFELLVSLVSFRVTYPQNYEDLSKEDLTDFKRTRYGSRSSRGKPLHWTSCLKIAEDVAHGLAYLHQASRLIHGNLKSSNVLVGGDFEACITDFGLTVFDSEQSEDTNLLGYKAPECKSNKKIGPKSDVYSFGVLLLELLTGKTPLQSFLNGQAMDLQKWVHSIREEMEGGLDGSVSATENSEDKVVMLLNISMACVSSSPEQRPTMRQVLRMIEEVKETRVASSQSGESPRWYETIQSSMPRDTYA